MFGPDGGLVANAPHIPVHLGAMQEAVQYQVCLVCAVFDDPIDNYEPHSVKRGFNA
ncbi:hypothetical protein DPMN_178432 [Dreissena polymorpha]|uniref:Hydantoinase B/oxoprolinase domain-containing protein n=1 Tax=Dreissena polymorpha TaxID=45954 RepID=A0A9D4ECW0_DREPO|nr:hypothetical protein DPMN_178432 [Dreissena polymorpha]